MIDIEVLDNDREDIISYINAYAPSGERPAAPMASFSYLMRHWAYYKESLYKIFNGNLILRKPYSYKIPREKLYKKMDKEWRKNENFACLNTIYRKIIDGEAQLNVYRYSMMNIFSYHALVDNNCQSVMTDLFYFGEQKPPKFKFPGESKPFQIFPEMKPMKALRKIFEAYGDKYDSNWRTYFEEVRLAVSRVLNNANLHGELCLSIHPLDYMTMSDNDNDWCSCMRWQGGGGEYSQGTIEMMNSPTVLVAYLHNPKNPMCLPNGHEWNNKIWRQLWVVSDEVITEVKAYPYDDENISSTVFNWIKDLVRDTWGDYENRIIEGNESELPVTKDWNIAFNFREGYMYNDFGCAPRDHMAGINIPKINSRYNRRNNASDTVWADVEYSGPCECMWCGGDIASGTDYDYDDESINGWRICGSCVGRYSCDCCGNLYNSQDSLFYVDGMWLCEDCLESHTVVNAITGEAIYEGNAVTLYLANGKDADGQPNFTGDYIYLNDNISPLTCKKYFTSQSHFWSNPHRNWITKDYVDVSECTEDGLDLFEYDP